MDDPFDFDDVGTSVFAAAAAAPSTPIAVSKVPAPSQLTPSPLPAASSQSTAQSLASSSRDSLQAPARSQQISGSQPTKKCRSRAPAKETSQPAKKRYRSCQSKANQALTRTPLAEDSTRKINCIFVIPCKTSSSDEEQKKGRRKQGSICVPLWPQYSLTATFPGLEGASWLVLSERQEWLLALVSALRPRNARGTACGTQKYKMADEVCKVWCGHFGEALKVKKDELETSLEKKAEDECKRPPRGQNLGFAHIACMDVVPPGATTPITMLNVPRPITLMVNESLVQFVQKVIAPNVSVLAPSQQAVKIEATPAPYTFEKEDMPNIQGKVVWVPKMHGWKVGVRKPRLMISEYNDCTGQTLIIDTSLSPEEFEERKGEAYLRAIDTWNKVDGTNRARIPVGANPF